MTGEHISALEGIGENVRRGQERDGKTSPVIEGPDPEASAPSPPEREIEPVVSRDKTPDPEPPAREKRIEMDLSL